MAASLVEEVDAVGAYPCLGGVGMTTQLSATKMALSPMVSTLCHT